MTLRCVWRKNHRVSRWLLAVVGLAYAFVGIGVLR